ncbi:hypothetical protein BKA64DRAFT_742587 [Cadophora sp. MPI-SDFR-AT-0126]|nr:hypothetical protein BKA64DRAFT_742587 [Leotiomycetes sp. MPI-SDFR-AT-0126]
MIAKRWNFPIITAFLLSVATILTLRHTFAHVPSRQVCANNNIPLQETLNSQSPMAAVPVGIGLDLTAFYGTVAITNTDGSAINIARVEARSQYRKAIQRLSSVSSIHLCPPYNAFDEYYRDIPRRTLRALRKAAGLPASRDVAALSAMIQDLRCKAEAILGTEISSIPILAVTPSLVALCEEDLVDAFEYAGLQQVRLKNYSPGSYVHETSAAYAGYGLGLCSDPQNPAVCQKEEADMQMENILSLLFTRSALRIIYTPVRSAYFFSSLSLRFYAHWDLGLDARDEEGYWKRVREAIEQGPRDYPGFPMPDKVLLMGESARDERFRSVLEEIISGWGASPQVFGDDTEFVAAKGAAELARRSVYKVDGTSVASEAAELKDTELKDTELKDTELK